MFCKRFIQIDGKWHRVYTTHDWYDWICWGLTVALMVGVLAAAATGRLC